MIALAITAPRADAAATRAEYVAQVDPICLAAAKPEGKLLIAYLKAFTRLGKGVAEGGSPKQATKRLVAKSARLMTRIITIEQGVTAQIEAVSPPPSDSGTVALWLEKRKLAEQTALSGTRALKHRKIASFNAQLDRSAAIDREGRILVAGLGFQFCA
jgi:hypothetical protein